MEPGGRRSLGHDAGVSDGLSGGGCGDEEAAAHDDRTFGEDETYSEEKAKEEEEGDDDEAECESGDTDAEGRSLHRSQNGDSLVPPTPAAYRAALEIAASSRGLLAEIVLPISGVPSLTPQQCRVLKRWAAQVQYTKLPNGLRDLRAADACKAPIRVEALSPKGRALVKGAVLNLRRKMEEINVSDIRRGWCARRAEEVVLRLDINHLETVQGHVLAEFGMGLDCLCRATAERASVLGPGGWVLLQKARRALREWLEDVGEHMADDDPAEACRQVKDKLLTTSKLAQKTRELLCVMAVASRRAIQADLARGRCGERGERTLVAQLRDAGVHREAYFTEDELRDVQNRLFGRIVYVTPDILLRTKVIINGDSPVHWIDSKGSCPLPGFAFGQVLGKLRSQLIRFVDIFGPGLVIWQGDFADAATEGIQGVRAASWALPDNGNAEGADSEQSIGLQENTSPEWTRWQ